VAAHFRVFLIGLDQSDLDTLRGRFMGRDALEIAGAALLDEVDRGEIDVADSVDALVMRPATWIASRPGSPSRRRDRAPEGQNGHALIEELTIRERDVLGLLAEGRSNRRIAAALGISEHTVKFHLASIFGKLGVSTRTEAARRAFEWSLIEI
jgi:DNA-binding CsgD family transcriptional regulator